VAQRADDGTTVTWTYLTTDHLGTPAIATDEDGFEIWLGPFEPFGRDYWEGSGYGASFNGIHLRLPGQWDDGRWRIADTGADLYYNVHRWYEYGTGRYSKSDPIGFDPFDEFSDHLFAYVGSRPMAYSDPLGLKTFGVGSGKACTDKNCRCEPPVLIKPEEGPGLTAPPPPGQCTAADAIYTANGVLKIPDNFRCTIKCSPDGTKPQEVACGTVIPFHWLPPWKDKVPQLFPPGRPLPNDWPPNPHIP
jgi:RHS repeat-associated protein